MSLSALKSRLARGRRVRLGTAEWEDLLSEVHVEESRATGAGPLFRLVRIEGLWVVVESYDLGSQELRAFPDREAAAAYLQELLKPYRHYWLGYG